MKKRDVGKIKIDDTETRFEISADKATSFSQQIRQPGSLEKGIMIKPAAEIREKPRQAKTREAKPKFKQDGKPSRKHQAPSPDRGKPSKHKGRKPKRPA